MSLLEITPHDEPGSHRTGSLRGLMPGDIERALGFPPNIEDDPGKVTHSWGFKAGGVVCGVWSYKGSEKRGAWSTFGPPEILAQVFGINHIAP